LQALLEFLRDDTTVITANRRLARAVVEAYADRQIDAGERVWRTPDVVPFSAWVERSWRACSRAAATALLRPAQERLLWEQVVRENTPPGENDEVLREVAPAARQAVRAYAIVNAWRISLDAREFDFSQESRAFRSWARAFEKRCARSGWLDMGRAASALVEQQDFSVSMLRRRAVFAGFDVITPQQHMIRSALSSRGLDVMDVAPPRMKSEISRRHFDDTPTELAAAAAWARGALRNAPAIRIGVVVPELHRLRAKVARIFDEWLVPGSALPGRGVEYRPFNISFAQPLSRIAVVGDALLALKLGRARSELAAVGRLLRSPYLRGGDQVSCARALLDARLRDIGEPEITPRTLVARARGAGQLYGGLAAIRALREQAPSRQPLSSWSVFFSEWLARLGWPGERALVSEEFQAVEAFRGLLDELAGMGAVAEAVGFDQDLSLLLGLAEEYSFQPRTDPAPVQILGALETAGLTFDKLWVTGLHDGNWPPAPEPHAFLPALLQRRAGLPQASPEAQLELAQRRVATWIESADQVVLSVPRLEKDEPLRPSPLITVVPLSADEPDNDPDAVAYGESLQSVAPALEQLDDERGPALADTHISRGGATLIRDQAACPFRAFARWRLGARAVPIAASPLDARIRGNLVHAVLFDFWSQTKTHSALSAFPVQTLRERVALAVDRALEQEQRARPDTLRGSFARAEHQRLCTLVEAWLLLEKERTPFEVVAREKNLEAAFGPLTLSIRPDRIDRLGTGRHLVVDYKTGGTQVKDWFGERPDDPQLALYTLVFESAADGGEVAGAAYATLRRGKLGFNGLAQSEGIAEGMVTLEASRIEAAKDVADWETLKACWRKTLGALAAAFASGEAQVNPKRPRHTCSYCEVKPFCRVFEHRANVMVETGE
jgi:probable DNA repair protein